MGRRPGQLILTDMMKTFAKEVVAGTSLKQSYIAAGYSKIGAQQGASRLYRHPLVREEIKRLKEKSN